MRTVKLTVTTNNLKSRGHIAEWPTRIVRYWALNKPHDRDSVVHMFFTTTIILLASTVIMGIWQMFTKKKWNPRGQVAYLDEMMNSQTYSSDCSTVM